MNKAKGYSKQTCSVMELIAQTFGAIIALTAVCIRPCYWMPCHHTHPLGDLCIHLF